MNEIQYFIVDANHNIVDYGLDLIYTIHHFIRGTQFTKLTITPAVDTYDLAIPTNGATDQADTNVTCPVQQLKKIQLDDQSYFITCFALDPGFDEEVPEP